jgi:hypothetical protein
MTTLLGDARIRIRPDFSNFEKESKGHISRVGPILATAIKGTIVAAGAGLGAASFLSSRRPLHSNSQNCRLLLAP